ncbi:pyridoxal phosphate-dependent transferase [Cristinia sonorae]|uniref:Pyridoxal phosphate-dependent transferase n=1 Tax=Cristinia sonorae TaxID=1940300 RepID=A0A8K0UZ49_9AGAR|nr:pyridoxal phosphate-dependent transferase [Cristinia sonorae]
MSSVSSVQLGVEIPYGDPHALSVSLPTWQDNVAWVSGNEGMFNLMSTGYPRFFVHRMILQLADIILQKTNVTGRLSHLFPTAYAAHEEVAYLKRYAPTHAADFDVKVAIVPLDDASRTLAGRESLEVYAVTFPLSLKKLGKSFWQHVGVGITSRYAEICLANINHPDARFDSLTHFPYPIKPVVVLHPEVVLVTQTLQARIASLAFSGKSPEAGHEPNLLARTNGHDKNKPVDSDVFLYPSGMSSIWHAHQLIMALKPGLKFVSFGFPYTDTIKVLEKWGPGCIFYGQHPDDNLLELEAFLKTTQTRIAALFCECPSNPLLQSPNLPILRELADKYDFLIVIDDTIGTFVNVNVLQYVDIVTTSLSKLFSGRANVLGGSMVLNPDFKYYSALKSLLASSYRNDFFLPDLIQMEENSRDFETRVHAVDTNTQAVCHYLRTHSLSHNPSPSCPLAIKNVFYPEWITRENYDLSRRPGHTNNFGHLFSLTFVSLEASQAFYDALQCAKGPSLGTNFTLCCPYTLLAHWWEREWAAEFGVEEGIVKVSVGMESVDVLTKWFEDAVRAAESTVDTDIAV